jgi:hypothetical protein
MAELLGDAIDGGDMNPQHAAGLPCRALHPEIEGDEVADANPGVTAFAEVLAQTLLDEIADRGKNAHGNPPRGLVGFGSPGIPIFRAPSP